QSANSHIDWAAAKKITLTTSGGAQIVIEAAGITVQCPGKITVRAAQKSFVGGGSESYPVDPFTRHEFCIPCFIRAAKSAGALVPA
ncbi:DUF2345 domain-containing protein, partial [Mycolicibacterium sp.]|uniref:DUF2345 domain-containing protein n=1 Tax=Mycolicibacterium sp. TaxID=2320850 RepID=UPI0037C53BD9